MLTPDQLRRLSTLAFVAWFGAYACLGGRVRAQAPELASPQPSQSAVPSAHSTPPHSADQASPTPSSPVEIGDSLAFHKRYQEAIAAYARVPHKTASVWNKMGIANQMMFNLNEAVRCYGESLKLDPWDPNVLNNLGTVYESQQDYRQAEKMYHKAIKLDPDFALAYKNLATSLMTQRKFKKGTEADVRALALDPTIFQPGDRLTVENPASVRDRGAMNYFMAVDCARAGQTACALDHLRSALNQGYTNVNKIAADSNFAALASDPGFQALLAEQRGK